MAETSDPPTELDISGTSETLKGKLETSVKASKEEEDEIKDTMAKRSHQLTEPDTSWTSGTLKGKLETKLKASEDREDLFKTTRTSQMGVHSRLALSSRTERLVFDPIFRKAEKMTYLEEEEEEEEDYDNLSITPVPPTLHGGISYRLPVEAYIAYQSIPERHGPYLVKKEQVTSMVKYSDEEEDRDIVPIAEGIVESVRPRRLFTLPPFRSHLPPRRPQKRAHPQSTLTPSDTIGSLSQKAESSTDEQHLKDKRKTYPKSERDDFLGDDSISEPLSSLSSKAESSTDEQHLHLKGQMKTVAYSKEDEDDKLKVSVPDLQAEEKHISEDETIESKVEELSLLVKPITQLQKVLNEFNEQTAKFNDKEKIDILLQLPYMTVSYFDNKGGVLSLDEYDVHLYIPRGAIPEQKTWQVYIYIDPDVTPADIGIYKDELLSPEIHCGPPGIVFLDTVVLSFPHHADESSDWKLDPRMCPDTSQAWQALDSSKDGQFVSSNGNSAVFFVSHFSKFSLWGIPSLHSRKRVKVGAFGDLFHSSYGSHTFRIYVWKNDKASEQKVLEMEKRMNSEILDAFRGLNFHQKKGDMVVEISNLKEGWCMRENTSEKQIILRDNIWIQPETSVTFDLKLVNDESNADTINIPHSDAYCYQLGPDTERSWQGAKVRLSIKPKEPVPPNVDIRGDISHRLPTEDFSKNISDAIQTKPACREFGYYGGLSENNVVSIYECITMELHGITNCNGIELREYLSGTGYIRSTISKRDVLKTYFAECVMHNISDEDAVGYLKWVFRCLDVEQAVQIIDGTDLNIDENRVKEMIEQSEPLTGIAVEICFREIADGLGQDWEKLGTFQGVPSCKLDEVKRNNNCEDNRIFKMLLICQNEVNRLKKLADNLERIDRNDLVAKLNRRVTSMKFFETAPNSRTETATTQVFAEDENSNQLPALQPGHCVSESQQDSV